MLERMLDKLENPKIPLLGPNVKSLEFWGLLLPKSKLKRYMYIMMHLSVMLFVATQFADIWSIKSDIIKLLQNLKISMLSIVNVCKVSMFLIRQRHWKAIIEYVTSADLNQRAKEDSGNHIIIQKFTKYCRTITYLYWFLTYATGLAVMLQPFVIYVASPTYRHNTKNGSEAYIQAISSWVPFDKNVMPGYLIAFLIQLYAVIYASGWITSFDTMAIVMMVFFKGELKLLRRDCHNMFANNNLMFNDEGVIARIREYHTRHIELINDSSMQRYKQYGLRYLDPPERYARLFDSCLSPIMLLYMFVCSVMLCATVYQITIETSAMQRFLTAEYLIFGIAQLFMYCWHSNEVLYVSKDLMLGPYESSWWKQSVHHQKDVNILINQFKKTIVFTAGPFTDLTVATFLSILKGAYSYYTLLSQSQA